MQVLQGATFTPQGSLWASAGFWRNLWTVSYTHLTIDTAEKEMTFARKEIALIRLALDF